MTSSRGAFVLAALIGSAGQAFADPPERHCWEGDETATAAGTTQRNHVVGERTIDRAANEIRSRSWSEKAPSKTIELTFHVDPVHNTFEFDHPELAAHGTGVLEGKPWAWTGYTAKLTTKKGDVAIRAQLTATGMTSRVDVTSAGAPIATIDAAVTYFDCGRLDSRRAALAAAR